MTELSIVVKATILLALGLAALRLARRASASMRHLILAATFGTLLALPAAVFLLPPVSVDVPIGHRGQSAASSTAFPAAQPAARTIQGEPDGNAIAIRLDANAPADRGPSTAPAPAWQLFSDRTTLLLALWGAGAVIFLLPVGAALVKVRDVKHRSTPWRDGQPFASTLARGAGVHRNIDMRVSEDVTSPTTFGLRRPVILMPANVDEWPGEHVQHAVLHELEHVRRADWAMGLGARIVCALYWFHPLVWIARRRLILESEHACDDAVVRRADRVAYAELLVSLAQRMTRPVFQTTLAMAARGDLSARVAAVLDQRRCRRLARAPLAAAVAATASCAAIVLATLSPRLEAQAPASQARVNQPPATFASVSVKASQPPVVPMWRRFWMPPGFHAMNVSLGNLIRDAYDVSPFQVSGPDWIETESFDITADDRGNGSDPGIVTPAQLRSMIRALLADRFKLVVHTEQRRLQAYALVRSPMYAGLGPKLWKPATDCDAERRPDFHEWLKQHALGQPECGGVRLGQFAVAGRGIPLSTFAVALETVGGVDRPIVDQTGLTGNFDLELTWSPQQDQLFELIQQQLGLALEPVDAPVDMLVVDRAERPTLN